MRLCGSHSDDLDEKGRSNRKTFAWGYAAALLELKAEEFENVGILLVNHCQHLCIEPGLLVSSLTLLLFVTRNTVQRVTGSQLEKPITEAHESHEKSSFMAQSCDSLFLSSMLQCLV